MKRASLTLPLLLVLLWSHDALAGWDRLYHFGRTMRVVYFVDDMIGFAATKEYDLKIYRTEDAGKTWKRCTTPKVFGEVTSITFRGDTGFTTIFSTEVSLLRSLDGGRTWSDHTPLDIPGYPHVSSCVDAAIADNALILSTWLGGGWTNDRSTEIWQMELTAVGGLNGRTNGVATNGQDIVVTGFDEKEWYSHDGGRTWSRTSDIPEAWGIYALAGTRSFYALPEGGEENPQRSLWRSQDGGETWDKVSTLSDKSLEFTGDIDGKGWRLYVQTETNVSRGLYRSDDLGKSWINVGGPSNDRDTRFAVTGCGETVYAFDWQGWLWVTHDGGDGTAIAEGPSTLNFEHDTVYIQGHSCTPQRLVLPMYSNGCDGAVLDSATVVGGATVGIENASSRRILYQDSLIFTHRDPVRSVDTTVITMHVNGEVKQLVIISRNTIEMRFHLGQPAPLGPGEDVSIPVYVTNIPSGVTVDNVALTIDADPDLLSAWRASNGKVTIKGDQLELRIAMNPPLGDQYDETIPIATLTARSYLTTTVSTPVLITQVEVTSPTAITACSTSEATYVQTSGCRDSLLRHVMTQELSGISATSPSPVRSFMQVEVTSAEGSEITILDMLGRPADAQITPRPGGYTVDCSSLSAGSYTVLLNAKGKVVGRRNFLKIDR